MMLLLMKRMGLLMKRMSLLMKHMSLLIKRMSLLIKRMSLLMKRMSLYLKPVRCVTASASIRFGQPFYTSKKIVGWVEALRNPTLPRFCWVSFLNPTYVYLLLMKQRFIASLEFRTKAVY